MPQEQYETLDKSDLYQDVPQSDGHEIEKRKRTLASPASAHSHRNDEEGKHGC